MFDKCLIIWSKKPIIWHLDKLWIHLTLLYEGYSTTIQPSDYHLFTAEDLRTVSFKEIIFWKIQPTRL